MEDQHQDSRLYTVVINGEQQYSLWLCGRELPAGWTEAGKQGTRSECLDYIQEVWTDMRPLSVRQAAAQPLRGTPKH